MSFLPIACEITNSSLRKSFYSNKALQSLSGRLCCHSGRICPVLLPLADIFFEICIDRNMKRKKTNIIYVTEVEICLTAGLCISTINLSGQHLHLTERRYSFLNVSVIFDSCVKTANKIKLKIWSLWQLATLLSLAAVIMNVHTE